MDRAVSFKELAKSNGDGAVAIRDTTSSTSAIVGGATRSALRVYQQIPLLSVPADLIRAKNGLEVLADEIRKSHNDPEPYLWMSEAIVRAQRDGIGLAVIRTVFEPLALIEAVAIRLGAQLGLEDPPAISLRKSAFSLAVKRLRSDPGDSVALHVASRVYLLQGDLTQALRFAWLATATAPNEPLPLITLAMTAATLGNVSDAAEAAWMAIDKGSTFGFVVLARLATLGVADTRTSIFAATINTEESGAPDTLPAIERARVALFLRRRVRPEDRDRYFGPRPHGAQVLTAALQSQKRKIGNLMEAL